MSVTMITPRRKRKGLVQVELDRDVFGGWLSMGTEEDLETDSEIAEFLITMYRNKKKQSEVTSSASCVNCGTPLPRCCIKCSSQMVQSQPPAAEMQANSGVLGESRTAPIEQTDPPAPDQVLDLQVDISASVHLSNDAANAAVFSESQTGADTPATLPNGDRSASVSASGQSRSETGPEFNQRHSEMVDSLCDDPLMYAGAGAVNSANDSIHSGFSDLTPCVNFPETLSGEEQCLASETSGIVQESDVEVKCEPADSNPEFDCCFTNQDNVDRVNSRELGDHVNTQEVDGHTTSGQVGDCSQAVPADIFNDLEDRIKVEFADSTEIVSEEFSMDASGRGKQKGRKSQAARQLQRRTVPRRNRRVSPRFKDYILLTPSFSQGDDDTSLDTPPASDAASVEPRSAGVAMWPSGSLVNCIVFECMHCPEQFRDQSSFRNHLQTHGVFRPRNSCSPCKPPRKSNAARCAEYRERLKKDAMAFAHLLEVKRVASKRFRDNRSSEQKMRDREMSRLRQQRRRARVPKVIRRERLRVRVEEREKPETSADERKKAERKKAECRAQARERQRKRRLSMPESKREMECLKRREQYLRKKLELQISKRKGKRSEVNACRKSMLATIREVHQEVKNRRGRVSKFSLIKNIWNRHPSLTQRLQYKRKVVRDGVVEDFYEEAAIDLPGKNTVSCTSMTPKKVLTKALEELFTEFRAAHPNYRIPMSTFCRRRPSHVLLSSSRAFLQCLCETCVNPMLKVEDVLNLLLTEKIKHVDQLVDLTLCRNFTRQCVDRKCTSCGVSKISRKWKDDLKAKLRQKVTWKRWEKTACSGKDQVDKLETLQEMIKELENEMDVLAKHLITARWQQRQYQELLSKLPPDHAVVTVDFTENYLCRFRYEVQSSHWSHKQVSLHPSVLQYRCPTLGCGEIVTNYIVHISDDLRHDAAFTKVVLNKILCFLKEKNINSIKIFSDGCSAQYKSKLPFVHLTELAQEHPELQIQRHFFVSHYGKSLCDSCGGVVRNVATRAVASGQAFIQCADDLLKFCTEKLTITPEPKGCQHMLRSFEIINAVDVDRSNKAESWKTMAGTRSLHALIPDRQEGGKLMKKMLSCFCDECMEGSDGCKNTDFTGSWQNGKVEENVHHLWKKRTSQQAQNDLGWQSGASPPQPESPVDCPVSSSHPESSVSLPLPSSARKRRDKFFEDAQEALEEVNTFDELRTLCFLLHQCFPQFPLQSFAADPVQIDDKAYSFFPADLYSQYIPASVGADGNCVCRSLRYLEFGTEKYHVEIRVRLTVEMVVNEQLYTDTDYLKRSAGFDGDLMFLLTLFSALDYDASLTLEEYFKAEVMAVRRKSEQYGAWELFAAANALNRSIISVYPELGPEINHTMLNRTFRPAPRDAKREAAAIFWTTTRDLQREHWVANHVVPLLSIPVRPVKGFPEVLVEEFPEGFHENAAGGLPDATIEDPSEGTESHMDPTGPAGCSVDEF